MSFALFLALLILELCQLKYSIILSHDLCKSLLCFLLAPRDHNHLAQGGDGPAVNISGQHVCVLRVRVPLLPPLASDMAYRVVRQGFDPSLQVFLCQHLGSASQLRLRPALVYKVGCTCVTLFYSQMGKRMLCLLRLLAMTSYLHFPGPFTLSIK
jgi:hypothetical protein